MTLAQILAIVALLSSFDVNQAKVIEIQNILMRSVKTEAVQQVAPVATPVVVPEKNPVGYSNYKAPAAVNCLTGSGCTYPSNK